MRKVLYIAVLLLSGAAATAQNLNPTVEVTNTYAREATGIEKPSQLLPMPDSLLRFNLDFDYSVRNSAYQGAYEFKPYLVQLRPQARPSSEGTLFLRGGAGYGFHPELTAVWTPFSKGGFRVNLYGDHHSYVGKYHDIALNENNTFVPAGTTYSGMEARSVLGANALYSFGSGMLTADAWYRNVLGKDRVFGSSNHILGAKLRYMGGTRVLFGAGVSLTHLGAQGNLRETHSKGDIMLGVPFGPNQFRICLEEETVHSASEYVGIIGLRPRYMLDMDALHIDAGILLSFSFNSNGAFYGNKSDFIFPSVRLSYDLIPESMAIHAAVLGGEKPFVYTDALESNPFLYSMGYNPLIATERFNIVGGVRGNLAKRLQYDASVGYAYRKGEQMYGFGGNFPVLRPVDDYHIFYVDLSASYHSDYLQAECDLRYNYLTLEEINAFAPAAFSGHARGSYTWGGRIRGGASLDFQTAQKAHFATLPGFADLGLQGDFQMTHSLCFWLKLGNLLNQKIQRIPLHAQQGLYFTLGAQFTL